MWPFAALAIVAARIRGTVGWKVLHYHRTWPEEALQAPPPGHFPSVGSSFLLRRRH